jgi:ribosomal protein S18 acetylase RimI-like enzyme
MSDAIIREPRLNEMEVLAALAAETFPMACPPEAKPKEISDFIAEKLSVAKFREHFDDENCALLVADRDKELIGYCLLIRCEITDADVKQAVSVLPTLELSKCYVLERDHGSGIAGALLLSTIERAKDMGVAGIWLGVNQKNVRAQRFYQKNGFKIVGEKTFNVGGQVHHDFVMEQAL